MRVLMDARLLRGGGIGRYIREIASRWLRMDEVAELRLLGHPVELQEWLSALPGRDRAGILRWTDPLYSPRAQLRWVRHGARWCHECDASFFPHWDAPAFRRGPPRLLTVHDLTQFMEPEGFPLWRRVPGRLLLARVLRASEGIVTVSRATLKDLEAAYPEAAERCRVIPNGVSHQAFRPLSPDELARARERWRKQTPFLLVVGPLKPHKGFGTALRVLRALAADRPGLRLVQVGPREVRDPEVQDLLADPELEARFFQAGVLDDQRLNEVYGVSECLLHPAMKEGFGLPPLEGMAAGTPVLASNRSSIPEVTGDGAILLDPGDPGSWVRAVTELVDDREAREAWIRRGRERAGAFSWERTARETLRAMQEVAGASRDSRASGPREVSP